MTLNSLCKLSRRYALLFTLAGLLAIYLLDQATDEMARVLLLICVLICYAIAGVMVRLAPLADAASRPRVEVESPLLEVVELGPRCPSRHLVDLALIEISEATNRAGMRTPGKYPNSRNSL